MNREPRRLREVLDQGQFAVTVEYNPPKVPTSLAYWKCQTVGRACAWGQRDGQHGGGCAGRISPCLPTSLRTRP